MRWQSGPKSSVLQTPILCCYKGWADSAQILQSLLRLQLTDCNGCITLICDSIFTKSASVHIFAKINVCGLLFFCLFVLLGVGKKMQINFLNRKKKSTSSFSETDSLETQNSLFFVVPPPQTSCSVHHPSSNLALRLTVDLKIDCAILKARHSLGLVIISRCICASKWAAVL